MGSSSHAPIIVLAKMSTAARISKEYLLRLKAKQLQQLAASIGARSTGTKNVLADELFSALAEPKIRSLEKASATRSGASEHRILSMDMGIRNLAYCTIALPPTWSDPAAASPPGSATARASLPRLTMWTRQAVSETPSAIAEAMDNASEQQAGPESYHPRTLAAHANALVNRLVVNPPAGAGPPPSTVLIERQRFRTMGASAVQEWTLRVNTFEGMLWAVLLAAKARGDWAGDVYSVQPASTARWWDGEAGASDEVLPGSTKAASRRAVKQRRIARVAQWLRAGTLSVDGPAAATAHAYLARLQPKKGSRATKADGDALKATSKLDDLADCLLQGIAWVRWEQNRRAIVRDGNDAVQELISSGRVSFARQTALEQALGLTPDVV